MIDVKLLRSRLAFVRRGAETQRYHTERRIHEDTVGHHSFNVAWLTMFLAPGLEPQDRAALLTAALAHDIPEHETGDIPAPTKRLIPGLKQAADAWEESLMAEVGLAGMAQLRPDLRRVLKLADSLDGMFYCVGELAMGNRRLSHVYWNFHSYVREVMDPNNKAEVETFRFVEELWIRHGGFPATNL